MGQSIILKNEHFGSNTCRGRAISGAFISCNRYLTEITNNSIKLGATLNDIKEILDHGQFSEFLEKINIQPRSAQNFMLIDSKLGNTQTFSHLGRSKLLQIARLDTESIEALEKKGHTENNELTLKKISNLKVRELKNKIDFLVKPKALSTLKNRKNQLVSNTKYKDIGKKNNGLYDMKLPNEDLTPRELKMIESRVNYIKESAKTLFISRNQKGLINNIDRLTKELEELKKDLINQKKLDQIELELVKQS